MCTNACTANYWFQPWNTQGSSRRAQRPGSYNSAYQHMWCMSRFSLGQSLCSKEASSLGIRTLPLLADVPSKYLGSKCIIYARHHKKYKSACSNNLFRQVAHQLLCFQRSHWCNTQAFKDHWAELATCMAAASNMFQCSKFFETFHKTFSMRKCVCTVPTSPPCWPWRCDLSLRTMARAIPRSYAQCSYCTPFFIESMGASFAYHMWHGFLNYTAYLALIKPWLLPFPPTELEVMTPWPLATRRPDFLDSPWHTTAPVQKGSCEGYVVSTVCPVHGIYPRSLG